MDRQLMLILNINLFTKQCIYGQKIFNKGYTFIDLMVKNYLG